MSCCFKIYALLPDYWIKCATSSSNLEPSFSAQLSLYGSVYLASSTIEQTG